MKDPKAHIAGLNLDKLSHEVPLSEAKVLTFGGEGVEAKEWQRRNVAHKNGWLIERDRQKGGSLVKRFSYRTHNELRTFPQILDGLYGMNEAFIDYGHIDLCGTITKDAIDDFTPILPLIFKSRGKCLAFTLADCRRNRILEQWEGCWARGERLFGSKAREIYQSIFEIQKRLPVNADMPAHFTPFDPEKGARREFGFLVEFAQILSQHSFAWMPSFIERYVYVSRYCGRPFRMRTYFFRFESKSLSRPARALARVWMKSRLSFANGDGFQEIQQAIVRKERAIVQPPIQKIHIHMPSKLPKAAGPSKLAALAEHLGGEYEVEYRRLAADSAQINQFRELAKSMGLAVPVAPPVKEAQVSHSSPKTKLKWESVTEPERIVLAIEGLEFKVGTNGDWNEKRKGFIIEKFGHFSEAHSAALRGVMSRAGGMSFRDEFRGRISQFCGENAKVLLDRFNTAIAQLG